MQFVGSNLTILCLLQSQMRIVSPVVCMLPAVDRSQRDSETATYEGDLDVEGGDRVVIC